ncbi:hypothetical protein B0T20DRAFT_248771 [Sordaria brevicollis]|uniref:Uncharacterized protein n=1 Tax=Sordaria brevicollis TaxID=83679 RepID=A0AAE0PCJ2_SORBR|nr:hypothetical protein B0T20DRAFT_248771 [Sordaria brevicollis]
MDMISDIVAGKSGQHMAIQNGECGMGDGALSKTKQREDPGSNRDVANDTIKTVWSQQGFPICFHPTRRDIGVILVKPTVWFWPNVRATPMRLVRRNGKGWGQEKPQAKKKRGDVNARLQSCLLHSHAGRVAWQALSIWFERQQRQPSILQQQFANQREGTLTRRDLTSPHASTTQQHLPKDTNTKLPTFTSHLLRLAITKYSHRRSSTKSSNHSDTRLFSSNNTTAI